RAITLRFDHLIVGVGQLPTGFLRIIVKGQREIHIAGNTISGRWRGISTIVISRPYANGIPGIGHGNFFFATCSVKIDSGLDGTVTSVTIISIGVHINGKIAIGNGGCFLDADSGYRIAVANIIGARSALAGQVEPIILDPRIGVHATIVLIARIPIVSFVGVGLIISLGIAHRAEGTTSANANIVTHEPVIVSGGKMLDGLSLNIREGFV